MIATISELPGYIHDYQMITSELIISALKRADPRKEFTESDFPDVRSLVLSNLNICTISNISNFTLLTKLDVANNALEHLDGLSVLVSLEVLDASFNKLTEIRGIEKLIRLTDLNLNNNKIRKIDPLNELSQNYKDYSSIYTSSHPLQTLNLANNAIDEVSETLTILKQFNNLKVLAFAGNQITTANIYRAQTVAYCRNLKYLDFQVILPNERRDCEEHFTTEINQMKDAEVADNGKTNKALTRTAAIRVDAVSDCLNFDNIVQSELMEGEQNQRIFQIPAIRNLAMTDFVPELQNMFKIMQKLLRRKRALREAEVCEFEEFYEVVLNDLKGSQDNIIQDYYLTKDYLYNIFNEAKEDFTKFFVAKEEKMTENQQIEQQSQIIEAKELLMQNENGEERGEEEAQEPESQQVQESENMSLDLLKESGATENSGTQATRRPKVKTILQQQILKQQQEQLQKQQLEQTRRLQEEELYKENEKQIQFKQQQNEFLQNTKNKMQEQLVQIKKQLIFLETESQAEVVQAIDLLKTALEDQKKKTEEQWTNRMQQIKDWISAFGAKSQEYLNMAVDKKMRKDAEEKNLHETRHTNEQLIADNADFTTQGQTSATQLGEIQQEIQNLLPAEMTPGVIALLKDRDTAKNAGTAATDYKITILDQRDDQFQASLKDFVESSMGVINGSEADRFRKRQQEIDDWVKREEEWISKVE